MDHVEIMNFKPVRSLFLFLFHLLFIIPRAQNLVPNPSFEDTVACPFLPGQITKTKNWINLGSGTSDYFFNCAAAQYLFGVPDNIAGYQQALSGQGYAGITCYDALHGDEREFLQVKLTVPLIKGLKYDVHFSVSRAEDTVMAGVGIAVNKIGARFRTKQGNTGMPYWPDNFAHVFTNTIITSFTDWTMVSGTFIADSAYKYVIIGNFFDDANTAIIPAPFNNSVPNYRAYYYVDDVSVTLDPGSGQVSIAEYNLQSSVSIYPNPSTGRFTITNESFTPIDRIRVRNCHGKEMKFITAINTSSFTLDLNAFETGIYFLEISSGGTCLHKLVIKQ